MRSADKFNRDIPQACDRDTLMRGDCSHMPIQNAWPPLLDEFDNPDALQKQALAPARGIITGLVPALLIWAGLIPLIGRFFQQ